MLSTSTEATAEIGIWLMLSTQFDRVKQLPFLLAKQLREIFIFSMSFNLTGFRRSPPKLNY